MCTFVSINYIQSITSSCFNFEVFFWISQGCLCISVDNGSVLGWPQPETSKQLDADLTGAISTQKAFV